MKYIIVSVRKDTMKLEVPFVFPDICVHAEVAKWMERMLFRQYNGALVCTVSAGFLSSMDVGEKCYGESESLQLKSRGKVDDHILSMADYGSIVNA